MLTDCEKCRRRRSEQLALGLRSFQELYIKDFTEEEEKWIGKALSSYLGSTRCITAMVMGIPMALWSCPEVLKHHIHALQGVITVYKKEWFGLTNGLHLVI